jgi:peptidyl-prolyl cis-trans isomerase A (cyclophilin A)/peptidyl-prolyl cis-trans isomerase B (cyclophilin B)
MTRLTTVVLALALSLAALPALAANPRVELKTTAGTIVVELFPDQAPKTVENFLQYVREDQYKGAIFHRVIPGFMIQGGGYDKGYQEKVTRAPIVNEAANGLKNEPGTIAMARTPDPNSARAQFFINVNDNQALNYRGPGPQDIGYAVFGKVVSGMDVVKKIETTPTGAGGPFPQNVPQKMVVIESARVLPEAADKK